MEIINPYNENFQDTKICRLCGSDNKENIDIFTSKPISSRSEDLLTKILSVYPIVLYKNDPLPQHICPKCIGNVSTTYQDIQQVMRQQTKWISLTKAMQPEHKYFDILNVVKNSSKATKESIKASYNIEIKNIPLEKFPATISTDNQNTTPNSITTNKDNINEIVVKNIQNKLESNGFTIKRIKVPSSTNNNQDLNESICESTDLIRNSFETSGNIVTCDYCKQKFSDLKILAQHQLIHLKLSANKIFQKLILPKQLRRGRLITLNDNKCIRCLNCWRIYKDNKAILQHWSGGECEFYCFVCGKEFPHSPKMLREHVAEIHGIKYRSGAKSDVKLMINPSADIKIVSFPKTTTKSAIFVTTPPSALNSSIVVKKSTYKKPPPKSCTKNEDGTITCKICHKVFDNFRSSNSHMRKHKPPNRFKEPVAASSSVATDKYNTEDDYVTQPSTSKLFYDGNTAAANSLHANIKPPRPAYRVLMKNGPLRGIKTKIVQKRHDFFNNQHLYQNSMTSIPDINDDDNLIVPELLTSAIKSEHALLMNDTHNNGGVRLNDGEYASNPFTQAIKSEPLDNSAEYVAQEPQICFICNESFSNARDYELHAMFVHNIN